VTVSVSSLQSVVDTGSQVGVVLEPISYANPEINGGDRVKIGY